MSTRFVSSVVLAALVAAAVPARAQDAAPLQPLPSSSSSPPPSSPPPEAAEEAPPPRTVVIPGGAAASTASAPAVRETSEVETPRPVSAEGLKLGLGLRLGYVPSSGFDTFASNDTLPQFSLDGTYGLLTRGRLTLAAGLGWDVGGRGSKLRGQDASLSETRFSVPLEGRYAFTRGVWGLVRIAPGATHLWAHLSDPAAPAKLADTAWAFSVDASVGAAFLLGSSSTAKKTPRFVLQPEVGYTLTTPASLSPSPNRNAEDVIGSDASTRLADVSLSGFFWRATVGLAF